MKSSTRKNWSGRNSVAGLTVGFIATLLAALLFTQRVWIIDSFKAWTFEPSSAVANIERRIDLSAAGSRIFNASEPDLVGTSDFNDDCQATEKTSVVIGCYMSGKIYIFDVTNDELKGIEEVTAAHEILHAAYDRLSSRDRDRVDELLKARASIISEEDPQFEERMSVYDELTSAERLNELHSVIGTEVAFVGSELEEYYKQYFDDRAKVVEYYQRYHGVFVAAEDRAKDLAASLDQQAASINGSIKGYNEEAAVLDADIVTFNRRAENGYFNSQEEFDAARALLVKRSGSLDKLKDSITAAINKYNSDMDQFDEVASYLTELNSSIDSSLAPSPTVFE